jgi:hypothetical protein
LKLLGSTWNPSRSRWHDCCRLACTTLVASLALSFGQNAQADLAREARIKAVLIIRLVKFVEWPGETRAEPLNICTWGESNTVAGLQTLQGQSVREREIRVRKLTSSSAGPELRGCQVLFVGEGVRELSPSMLYGSGNPALLTISEMPDFNKRGGIISLVNLNNRVAFDVHLRYAREAGLQIGAPLLQLARVVD